MRFGPSTRIGDPIRERTGGCRRPTGGDADASVHVAPHAVRMDMHCHSWASDKPVMPAVAFTGCPECYSDPEAVHAQAMARGMDLVTITDHDSIAGVQRLLDRGYTNVVIGEEVTVCFPEDRCKIHVLVWGHTPQQHEAIGALGLRRDVYAFAAWLREQDLAHAMAHPLYVQNGKLTRGHIERCLLLFRGFESLNGAHTGAHRGALEMLLDSLTPESVAALSRRHGLAPVWPEPWVTCRSAGSDDHGLLNVGRTWAAVDATPEQKALARAGAAGAGQAFLREVMSGRATVGGVAGRSDLLAHQLASVGMRWFGETIHPRLSPGRRALTSKLFRFAGIDLPAPGKARLALDAAARMILRRRKPLPIVAALKSELGPILERHPGVRRALETSSWAGPEGPALARHAEATAFGDDLAAALGAAMASGAFRALRERDRSGLADHLISYALVQAARVPEIISLFHQNKERLMLEQMTHDLSAPGSGASASERAMRVMLFTDTLGDVNGVCRFIRNVADRANRTGRDLSVVTSTRLPVPAWSNITNFEPVFATRMPRYEQLELALPPLVRMLRHADERRPDVIHISTPGPVGMCGYLAARMLRVPVLGVYHTDFPAYVDRLFDDHAMTGMTAWFMRKFYEPFSAVFTRSEDYMASLEGLGLQRRRMIPLLPGMDTDAFHVRHRDEGLWARLAEQGADVTPGSVKALYCGRVSVEKNLPLLTRMWPRVRAEARRAGVDAELVIVGDGPYRAQMERELRGKGAAFLGFRHGEELSAIYASSDLFVFPSTTDTLGQVVMESQASGLPVVVTDQGGPKEVVDQDLTGFVLPANDAALWTSTVLGLLLDPEKRRRMGRAAHTRMARYSMDASFEHYWKAHEQVWREHLESLGIRRRDGEHGRSASPAPEPQPVGA